METEVLTTTPGQQINVRKCGSCDGPHERVEVHEYVKDQAPYTHWYTCPKTTDPVPTALLHRGDNKVHEPNLAILKQLVEAEASGEYLVAICFVSKGRLEFRRTTVEFPTAYFTEAVRLLDEDLSKESGPPQKVELVTAEPAGPKINVFND